MITQRAWLVGIVGFCFYLIALVNALPTYFNVLTWLSVSILVSSGGVALLSLQGLDCTWRVSRATVTESLQDIDETGDEPLNEPPAEDDDEVADHFEAGVQSGPVVEVRLANSGTLNKTGVLLDVVLEHRRSNRRLRRRFLIEALPSGMTITTALALDNLPRGRYHIVEMRLIGSDVLGLFRARRHVSQEQGSGQDSELIVGPATITFQDTNLDSQKGDTDGEVAASILLGHSDEMRGIRPYAAGDDLRRVHWKSTARLGRLVVKEFDYAARPDCVVIWDGAAVTQSGGAQPGSMVEMATEHGLRIVASLCRFFLERGRPCALLRLDSEPVSIFQGNRNVHSAALLSRCMEALADANPERTTPLSQAVGPYLRDMPSGSEVYLVTAVPSPELVQSVLAMRGRGLQVKVGLVQTWDAGSATASGDQPLGRKGRLKGRNAGLLAREAELYNQQVRLLRESDVPVVTLIPSLSPTRSEMEVELRTALLSLLGATTASASTRGREISTAKAANSWQ